MERFEARRRSRFLVHAGSNGLAAARTLTCRLISYRHRTEEPKAEGFAVGRALCGEVPVPVFYRSEVPLPNPPCTFGGMPALCPPPEHVPDEIVDSIAGCLRRSVAMVDSPTTDDRVEQHRRHQPDQDIAGRPGSKVLDHIVVATHGCASFAEQEEM